MIEFTQYLHPRGRTRQVAIKRAQEVEAQAHALQAVGARFEIEVLSTAAISMEVVIDADGETETLASKLAANGPGLPIAVDAMVRAATERAQHLGLLSQKQEV